MHDEPPWTGRPGQSADDDMLEMGRLTPSRRPPRPSRPAAVLAAVALAVGVAVGLGAGYLAGARHQPAAAATPATPAPLGRGFLPASVAVGEPTLAQTGNQCSLQQGTTLQLGIQVTNQSAAPLTLGEVRVSLPTGGLRVTGVRWGPCGELNDINADGTPEGGAADQDLSPGASGWLTVTTKVLVACPGPIPVQFTVGYKQHGTISTVQLPGFPDLSGVPYSGCPAR